MDNLYRDAGKDLVELLEIFPEDWLALSDQERRVSLALYGLLAEGAPVSVGELAARRGASVADIVSVLDAWEGVYRDGEGRIVGYWGLAVPEMDHRFQVGGRTLYTWCAWDSLFIPELLGRTARVESACPVSGADIRLVVSPERIEEVEPAGAVISFAKPEEGRLREDIVRHFCHYVHFFRSLEAGRCWVEENEGTLLLSLEEAHCLGKKKNEIQYGRVLRG